MKMIHLLCFILIGVVVGQRELSPSELNGLRQKATALINTDSDLIPKFVRMAFHDCVGGCDGCLEFENTANNGLRAAFDTAKKFRQDSGTNLTQADINVFLGIHASETAAIPTGNKLNIEFRAGRFDCTSPEFPPRRDFAGTDPSGFQTLQGQFGLTELETCALLGAHTLGHMNKEHAGFHGAWDETPLILDTKYFQTLLAPEWVSKPINLTIQKSSQWEKGELTMLNADMIMVKRFRTSGEFSRPSCGYSQCPAASTAQMVRQLADDLAAFHREYSSAFTKMISTGFEESGGSGDINDNLRGFFARLRDGFNNGNNRNTGNNGNRRQDITIDTDFSGRGNSRPNGRARGQNRFNFDTDLPDFAV